MVDSLHKRDSHLEDPRALESDRKSNFISAVFQDLTNQTLRLNGQDPATYCIKMAYNCHSPGAQSKPFDLMFGGAYEFASETKICARFN